MRAKALHNEVELDELSALKPFSTSSVPQTDTEKILLTFSRKLLITGAWQTATEKQRSASFSHHEIPKRLGGRKGERLLSIVSSAEAEVSSSFQANELHKQALSNGKVILIPRVHFDSIQARLLCVE